MAKVTTGQKRWAKSYSIVDHGLLHGGHLHRLSHQAMALYLFLVVVGDPEGRSFYAEQTIVDILRLTPPEWRYSLKELIESNLIEYRRPYFWVKNLTTCRQLGEEKYGRDDKKDTISKRCSKPVLSSDRSRDWYTSKEGVQALLRHLGR